MIVCRPAPARWRPLALFAGLCGVAACAAPPVPPAVTVAVPPEATSLLHEAVVPNEGFRAHRLARCLPEPPVPPAVERYLGVCSEYFRDGSGSDGMIELELGLAAGHRHPLLLLTLGQLYLLAGQGDPDLLPVEGPAADVGSYAANKPRLLARARDLLAEAAAARPDEAALDFLLADVARASGDQAQGVALVARGLGKCTGGRSFQLLQLYQQLSEHAPRHLGGPAPEFPQDAVDKGIGGEVVLDLLLSPGGLVRQFEVVQSPAEALTEAAWQSLRRGRFEPASVGKYPVWSWLRVTTNFRLVP